MILSHPLQPAGSKRAVAAATGPVWFQLYVYRDRGATAALVGGAPRPPAAGRWCSPSTCCCSGRRERDVRKPLHRLAAGARGRQHDRRGIRDDGLGRTPARGSPPYVAARLDPSGVVEGRGVAALDHRAAGGGQEDRAPGRRPARRRGGSRPGGLEHGGRLPDTAPATLDVLPEIADTLAAHASDQILLDGGVRRGTDVLKALALPGARAIPRPRRPRGLAADGETGAAYVLRLLPTSSTSRWPSPGAPTVKEITRDLVRR